MPLRLLVPALIVVLTSLSVSSATPDRALRTAGENHAALDAFHGLPLAFVANAGQLDRRARFSAQAGSGSVFLTRRGVVVALAKGRRGLALRLAFLGASPQATITGADRSPGRVNYLIGNDPARWQTNLPTYAEVLYRELWPGIDLAVRGQGGQLKYEFRLDPGADPARIRLRYRGQERLSLGSSGALRIETALGLLRDARPISYQPVNGRRVPIASRFVLSKGGAYGFALGAYDHRYPLVIDPGLVYSSFLGGTSYDRGSGIALDRAGGAYLTGSTWSRNFPTTAGALDRSHARSGGDVFVTKLNAASSALVYSTYLGGNGSDGGEGITVDGLGSAYITGTTGSASFPTTAGAFDRSYNGYGDAFVAKLNAVGSGLAYATYLGGGYRDEGLGIAVDRGASAYVTGLTTSGERTTFPTTAGAYDRTFEYSAEGFSDAFVTKLSPTGSALAYSTYLGGSESDSGTAIAVDAAGGAYITGHAGDGFPTTAGAFQMNYTGPGLSGFSDAFVTKLNAAGSALTYSTYLGGEDGDDYANGMAVDGTGSVYLTGSTTSRNFPTTGAALERSYDPGGEYGFEAFVTKLNLADNRLAYSTYLGGSGDDDGVAIAVDGAGSAHVTGSTTSTNFPTTAGALDRRHDRGGGDVFVTKLNPAGSALVYSTYLGGSGDDGGGELVLDRAGSAYVAGTTRSRSFPTTAGAFDRSYNEDGDSCALAPTSACGDAFVAKLDLTAPPSRGFSIVLWQILGAVLISAALATLVTFAYLWRKGPLATRSRVVRS